MCPSDIHHCKIPKYLGSDFSSLDRFVIILEDLDTVGYSGRHYNRKKASKFKRKILNLPHKTDWT